MLFRSPHQNRRILFVPSNQNTYLDICENMIYYGSFREAQDINFVNNDENQWKRIFHNMGGFIHIEPGNMETSDTTILYKQPIINNELDFEILKSMRVY